MFRQRAMFRVVGVVVAFVFFWTNCVWADNLAVQSQLAEVLSNTKVVYTGTAVHSALITEGITDLQTLRENQDRIKRRLRETIGDAVDKLKTLIFGGKEGGIAYYTFSKDGFFYRFTTREKVDDPFNRLIEGFITSPRQRKEVPINGDTYYQEIIQISPQIVGFIETCLDRLYKGGNPISYGELYSRMKEGKVYTVETAASEFNISAVEARDALDWISSIDRETEPKGEFKGIEKVVMGEDEEVIYQWLNPDSINKDIFRDYDYRSPEKGSIDFSPKRLFFMTLTWVSMAFEKAGLHDIKDRRVVIARDCRKTLSEVIEAMIKAVEYSGLKAIYVGKTPNCAASYAWAVRKHHPLMGIFLTASHVKGDNVMGAKVSIRGRSGELESLDTPEIQRVSFDRLKKILSDPDHLGLIKFQPIKREPDDVIPTYTEMARIVGLVASGAFKSGLPKKPNIYDLAVELEKGEAQDILEVLDRYRQIVDLDSKPFKGFRIVIEAAHTPSGKLAKGVYEALGAEVIILNGELIPEGLSGQHKADPSIDENLKELKDAIEKHNAHFGLAFDLDGDRGAIVVPTNKKDSQNKTIFTTLSPDNLMVVLLPFFNKRGYSKKERGKVAVVRDVLSTKGVARKAEGLEYKYRQTDAGYVFLKEAVREFKGQGFTVPIYAERSGHAWAHVTGAFEDPIVVSIFFAIMGMEYMKINEESTHPFIEVFQKNTIPYKQSTRFQPLFTDSLLGELAGDRENDTGWVPGGKDKPPQKIIKMGRHKVITRLLEDFKKGKNFNTPIGKLVVREIIPIIDNRDNTYRAADIRFDLDGSDAGSFVFRASANDPTWVCSFETPVRKGETLESENVQLRYECIGGLVLDYLERNGYAKVFGEDFSYSNKRDAEESLVNYRISLGTVPDNFMRSIDHIMRMLGIKDYSRIIQTFKTSIDPVAFVNELEKLSKKDVNTILDVLRKIPFFNTIALDYSVRIAERFNPGEYGAKKLDVYIGDSGYELSGEPQPDITGEPLSDYISAKRAAVSGVPFVFRNDMESYVRDFLQDFTVSKSLSPDLVKRISQIDAFFKKIDLSGVKYVITSGIGANEMYSHQLAMAVNAYFKGVRWIVVNNPAHQSLIPEDADNTNTVIFEMSRSGSTQETVDFFNATKGRFKHRIVAANSGRLKEESLRLKGEPGAVIYNIDDIPGDIGGRQMNRKTLMVYVPLFMALVAGTKDIAAAKELLKGYVKASLESNSSLSYSNGLDSEAVRMAEFLLRQRTGAGRKRITLIYDLSLKGTSKELFQLLNEGANKNIAGGTNYNILDVFSLDERESYDVIINKMPNEQLPIFLLNKNSPDYTDTMSYIEGLRGKGIPCIVLGVNLDLGEKPDLSHNLKVLARITNLLQDMAVYFTYITNQDANSNPAVKFVREITAVMFDILREKKSKGETDIRITFRDVIEKIDQKRKKDKTAAKQVMDQKGVGRRGYREEFNDFRDSIRRLANSLGIKAEHLTAAIISVISKGVVETDVGEAGGVKNADIDEAFSRTILLSLLGGRSRPVRLDRLEKQIYLSKTERVAISVALEKDSPLRFKGKEDLAVKIANYFYEMYINKGRAEKLTHVPLICMEADEENPIIKEILRDMLDNLSDLGISCPRLFLPRAAHTGIEAVMSHPENIFLVSIISTKACGGELGNKPIDGQTTIDDATYVYGIGNVIRMALGGSPSVIFEITDTTDLEMVRDTLKEAFRLFRKRIEEKPKDIQGSHIVKRAQGEERLERSLSIDGARGEIPALRRLEEIYGPGITTQVDEIQIVENLGGEGVYPEGRAPLASYRDGVLKVDKLVFDYGDLILFEELEHEFLESIAGLIPGINHGLADVVSTFMNVKRFLGLSLEEQDRFLSVLRGDNPIDPDGEYLALLESIRTVKNEDVIIASVVRYVLRTKLYEKVRDELGLPEELAAKIRDLGPRLDDVLQIVNEIAGAKVHEAEELTIKVIKTFSGVRIQGLDKISKKLAGIITALVKAASKTDGIASLPLAMTEGRYYIVVDKDRITKEMEEAIRKLENNGVFKVVYEVPSDYDPKKIIHLVDPGDLKEDMQEGILYLPMPYLRSSLYMAASVVVSGGDAARVDPLIIGLIKGLYREITDSDLDDLFNAPWRLLPKIQGVLAEIENLHKALAEIEKAA